MNEKIKVLLAEDESSLGLIVKESLENRNFLVTLCDNGEVAFETFLKNSFDTLVLDIMMPKKDGFTLAEEIRKLDKEIPIVFLTAKSQTQDVVKGFKIGCNDYIKKPFSMEELIVRIIALTNRKHQIEKKAIYHLGTYQFNPDTQILQHKNETFKLTNRESLLLEFLLQNKGEILSRELILNTVWKNDDFFSGRSMDVFITRLRKKLNLDQNVAIINSRGRGYKLIC
ncbi:response regulator transcription factor [Flavobacterium jejuense]|uniref:Response regulator transcription factor n=1 Tax=Flavobacterium jejuense TaxID=1544455 RepID=A0ABX0IUZ2_9FLAO|nr:response regulator transcription factor [Flavobacterium jejuense]NHN27632.1 response regulator transcription factor [Flavobacterium jejuense]